MFRWESILVRRPGDDREAFGWGWARHSRLVAELPNIRSYVRNHVVEDFGHAGPPPILRADGIVELLFDSEEWMRAAFGSQGVAVVRADESNFISHGTGYCIADAPAVRPAGNGAKLVVAARTGHEGALSVALETAARAIPGAVHVVRDDVVSIVSKPWLPEGPQQVDTLLHIFFDDIEKTRAGGRQLLNHRPHDSTALAYSIFRVRTVTVI